MQLQSCGKMKITGKIKLQKEKKDEIVWKIKKA